VQVGREHAHRRQPVVPPARVGVGGQDRPGQGHLGGDHLEVVVGEVAHELAQQSLGALEFEPQRPAQPQVVGHGLLQRGHDVVPGQRRATVRSVSTSTFA